MLWAYKTITNKYHKHTPFQPVYGREEIVSAKFMVPSNYINHSTHMMEEDSIKERLAELMELEESCFLSNYHAIVMKQ